MELSSIDFLKQQDLPAGALYMVATPIGNLGDITLRALHVLNAVDGIACEDTRHSAALLQQFGIHKKCLALHEHNEISGAQTVIQHLSNNERWAYISDAGTFYTYENMSGNIGWDVLRSESPKVDIDSVTRLYLYNKDTNSILTNLDHIDPAKGKILGAAEQDIDFKTVYDPAIYNVASSTNISVSDRGMRTSLLTLKCDL